ncbi:NAD(P)-binding protein [Coniochaeta sp. PMI_546]|nr:NAD(P)-binding protein [Coniochaeta sp. PMI_546]
MSQRFPSVALIGATGNVGRLILQALREAQPPFESITVLTRSAGSNIEADGSNIRVRTVDYSSRESISTALKGVDAVVSAIATQSVETQKAVIDAAVDAGVRFFIPSEFGLANTHPLLRRDFPIFTDKTEIQDHLETLRRLGKIDYALIFVGLFLDWGMDGFVIDVKKKKISFWDKGERPISMTTMASIGKAVAGVLEGKVEGKREVRVKDINISQKRLYELAVEIVGKDGWDVRTIDTAQAKATASEKLAKGTADLDDIYAFVYRASTAEEYGQPWKPDEDDSERIGLRPWTEDDVRELIREVAGLKK